MGFTETRHRSPLFCFRNSKSFTFCQNFLLSSISKISTSKSENLKVGDWVIAIGNAFGLVGTPTVTVGIVSAKERVMITEDDRTLTDMIQTDAAINEGNSGGPLVNLKGELVGINSTIMRGAEGIGFMLEQSICSLMKAEFFQVREMILSKTIDDRNKALAKLLPHQKKDFTEIFEIMNGLPVTVRLLDPPLHEFLPKNDKEINDLSNVTGLHVNEIKSRTEELHEHNPMLGHRGCRLGISFPEIYEMQCRAIFEALIDCKKRKLKSTMPEIMIPLVSTEAEIKIMKDLVIRVAKKVQDEHKTKVNFLVGTMIELPRAAIKAKDIAKHAEFFSFGTNDLTQTTLGISRDDAGSFLRDYSEAEIYPVDPFISIDVEGVGILIEMAAQKGRKIRPNIKLGICGEHGGDPKSINFCSQIGLNYVSCSPYRVPIARLAAAQAEIKK